MHTPPSRLAFLCAATGVLALGFSGCDCRHMQKVEAATDAGPVTVRQMGGDIHVDDAPNGANLTTMGGNIHLGKVGAFAKVKTMGGNIDVDHASASVDATTMGGKIYLHEVNGAIQASTMAGDITARMVGSSTDRRDVELSSKSGTIVLIVPKDFSMDVRITLAYRKSAGDHYRIIDHVGLAQRESDDWETANGSPRKYIRAEGKVGGGRNHVKIDTINGDVILKQE